MPLELRIEDDPLESLKPKTVQPRMYESTEECDFNQNEKIIFIGCKSHDNTIDDGNGNSGCWLAKNVRVGVFDAPFSVCDWSGCHVVLFFDGGPAS